MKTITDTIMLRYIEKQLHEDNMQEIQKLIKKNPLIKKQEKSLRLTLKALKNFGQLLELKNVEPLKEEKPSNIIMFSDFIERKKQENKEKIRKIKIL
tara:strand:- start:404 stop:694 length:291 start_codon:yes stop_codon:yes gene_type:complete